MLKSGIENEEICLSNTISKVRGSHLLKQSAQSLLVYEFQKNIYEKIGKFKKKSKKGLIKGKILNIFLIKVSKKY